MNMKDVKEPEIDLDAEYEKILGNEKIYLAKIGSWSKRSSVLGNVILVLIVGFIVSVVIPIQFQEIRQYLFFFSGIMIVLLFFANAVVISRSSKIQNQFGLPMEERVYLRAYETSKIIRSYLKESDENRRQYFRKSAVEKIEKVTEIVDDWTYGNTKFVKELVGDQIDLLKDNMKRLVLSNVAKGEETVLKRVSEALHDFCRYVHSPSLGRLNELNFMINALPFKEYKVFTAKERISSYLYGKPRTFRFIFALGVAIVVGLSLSCLSLDISAIVTVAGASFWGAFMGFDKIFRFEK